MVDLGHHKLYLGPRPAKQFEAETKKKNLSFGILPFCPSMSTITAPVTISTAGGGDPKDLSSVRLACESNLVPRPLLRSYFSHLIQGVQRLFSSNKCRLSFFEISSTVGLFDGDLDVDLVDLDLLLVCTCLLFCYLLSLNPNNLDQFVGLK